ncbi:nucleoside diphosphate-linked moiety X motif 8-like isoform X3 [Acanthaster planci]|uniref:Nucleoside diphosphate-linked moiety X motif 8-like isoform X3 n=1 Tax=Acanthaster planci TaxID=133434 RepID=A0A8B7YEQ2_ACAPL|nr:nucleoside diphosphate-linked moiety X motif 8-like isoform X3 [Acanthaster planci]
MDCFPGGIKDDNDVDATQTMFRELKEELGICAESVEIWGQLVPSVPDRSGKTSVTAIVAYIGDIDLTELQYDKKEVELVFTLPISHLCDPQNHGYTRFDPSKSTSASTKEIGPYVLPVFRGAGYHIWGLTAVLTDLTLGVLAPDHYKSLFF